MDSLENYNLNIIKKNRYKLNLTQKQVAIKCNVKQSYISEIETNSRKPSANMIIKLSDILDISPIVIFQEFYCDKRYDKMD